MAEGNRRYYLSVIRDTGSPSSPLYREDWGQLGAPERLSHRLPPTRRHPPARTGALGAPAGSPRTRRHPPARTGALGAPAGSPGALGAPAGSHGGTRRLAQDTEAPAG